MRTELTDKLFQIYPRVFPTPHPRIVVGDGWYEILSGIARKFDDLGDVIILEVRQKIAVLRVDILCPVEKRNIANTILMAAEARSTVTCEDCSEAGRPRSIEGYYRTLCETCAKSWRQRADLQH